MLNKILIISSIFAILILGGIFVYFFQGEKEIEKNLPKTAFIAIHMEVDAPNPVKSPKILDYQEEHWEELTKLVNLADNYEIKLTLGFTPQWASYILLDEEKLSLVRGWEAEGHEIALHHHGPTHGDWDGYTNVAPEKTDARYIGTIQDIMKIMNQLPVSGKIYTGTAITNERMDWPQSLIYDATGGEEKEDLLSSPKQISWRGYPVTQVRNRQYATRFYDSAGLKEIESAYNKMNERVIMGIVFHVFDYGEKPEAIVSLFDSLKKNNVEVKIVREIMKEKGY